ncbi:ABC transporter permease subunit [Actinomadura sp. 3N407]|uniref:ABC transporter permease subunit n=1 Tax=Actinomadura sp. 3N407 TaxID=3457423 RepID=UPI003FCDB82A
MSDIALRNVFTKTLWDDRRVLAAWIVAVSAVAMMYASFYPQMADGAGADAAESMPEAMRQGLNLDDMTSAAGYLGGSVFGLLVPMLAMFHGAATGSRMIGTDEESGHLDLLLAHPLRRTRLVLQRFAALAAGAAAIAAVLLGAMLAIRSPAELGGIGVGEFAAQCLGVALLSITFGALAMALGAALGRRAVVFGVTAGAGILAYALNGFASQLGADRLRYLSPFHYYIGGEPLRNGFQPGHALVLLAVSAALITVGTWRLNRRDIAV